MAPDLAVVNILQLVTNSRCKVSDSVDENSLGLIQDGAMLVERGRVIWTGTMRKYSTLSVGKPLRVVDASNKLVTPGFIDPHTHLIFGGSREDEFDRKLRGENFKQILESGGGILRTILSTRRASEEELFNAAMSRLAQLISSGVTTVEVKTGYGQDFETEKKMLLVAKRLAEKSGIDVIPTFLGLHSTPPEYKSPSAYVQHVIKNILPNIAHLSYKPVFSDCFCESDIFDRKMCRSYLKASAALGFLLKIHADEFSFSGGSELAAEMGCTSADHLEKSTFSGLKMMAKQGVIAVLLPGTALYSMIEPPKVHEIREAGCTIALGTDLSPNSWVESPQLVMMLASTLMRMTSAQALVASTFGAALALGRPDIGNLIPGAKADFVIHSIPDYRFLTYRIGGQYVESVFKHGVLIRQNRMN